mmetsp:Transcript_49444/g.138454  ORF Transcript_49444/g.138454 Transcript_49444/m.138454 type:complete len:419 (-) Transcript_49444:64-1320(-)
MVGDAAGPGGDCPTIKSSSEQVLYGEHIDPVFEGMVKEMDAFHDTLQILSSETSAFMEGIGQLSEGLQTVSENFFGNVACIGNKHVASDSCRLKEATTRIIREDATDSAIGKLRRNMAYNFEAPIKSHLENCEKLKAELEKRERRLEELRSAKQQVDECMRQGLDSTHKLSQIAENEFRASKKAFQEVDRHIFEWLYVLEAHRDDILDSSLQTLKFLQYEFFAMSAHAISGILPSRMEFRPMVDMDPECLKAQVELALEDAELGDAGGEECGQHETDAKSILHGADFTMRMVQRLAMDSKDAAEGDSTTLPVDVLSLSALLSHGVEEGPARRALRLHRNDTQAALDWLLTGGGDVVPGSTAAQIDVTVRAPTAGRGRTRLDRLRELRRQQEQDEELAQGAVHATGARPRTLGASFEWC